MTIEPLSAAVLAGGLSSRMGTDKALLPLTRGGQPMLQIVLDRLAEISDDLLVIAPELRGYQRFGARIVPDLHAGGGALVGIHSALVHAVHEHCFVVACDMPLLNPALLERMAHEQRDYDALVPLLPGSSRQSSNGLVYQTLHAIYRKQCLPAIEAEIAAEKRQVVGFFRSVDVRTMGADDIAAFDPTLRSFFNANTPEAFARARALFPLA
jgi:molybdopterin-guanine dinucleotide biosynthesis protein A